MNELIALKQQEMKTKSEKAFLLFLEKTFASLYEKIESKLARLFTKYSDEDGKITNESLFIFERDKIIERELLKEMDTPYKEIEKNLTNSLETEIERSYLYTSFLLAAGGVSYVALTNKQKKEILNKKWYGETYKQTLNRNKKELAKRVLNTILIESNEPTNIKNILKKVKVNVDSGVKRSLMQFTSEQTKKYNDATIERMDKLVNKDGSMNVKYVWNAVLDEKTCRICGKLDQKKYKKENLPRYPQHTNCRCVITEDLDEIFDQLMGRRAREKMNMTSYVTDEDNFKNWLKTLPKNDPLRNKHEDLLR